MYTVLFPCKHNENADEIILLKLSRMQFIKNVIYISYWIRRNLSCFIMPVYGVHNYTEVQYERACCTILEERERERKRKLSSFLRTINKYMKIYIICMYLSILILIVIHGISLHNSNILDIFDVINQFVCSLVIFSLIDFIRFY